MCYSAKVWAVSDTDAAHLKGIHFRLLRRIVTKTPEEHLTRDPSSAAHWSTSTVGTVVSETPAMGWAHTMPHAH